MSWQEDTGRVLLQQCTTVSASANLSQRASEFIPSTITLPRFRKAEWAPIEVQERVKEALSVGRSRCRVHLLMLLSSLWGQMHETSDHADMPEFDGDKGPYRNACRVAGICLCIAAGHTILKIVTGLHTALKKACPVKSSLRNMLVLAEISICLLGQARPPREALGEFDLASNALIPGVGVCQEHWLHIGSRCKTPWRSMLHKMQCQWRTQIGCAGCQVDQAARLWRVCHSVGLCGCIRHIATMVSCGLHSGLAPAASR